jgi:hypothetical protein
MFKQAQKTSGSGSQRDRRDGSKANSRNISAGK